MSKNGKIEPANAVKSHGIIIHMNLKSEVNRSISMWKNVLTGSAAAVRFLSMVGRTWLINEICGNFKKT